MIQCYYHRLIAFIKYVFIPPSCAGCFRYMNSYTVFCDQCTSLLIPVVSTTLKITERYIVTVYAACLYQEPVRTLIVAKQRGDALASHQLGQLMVARLPLDFLLIDYIVPIPIHWTRRLMRGYNQTEEMGYEIVSHVKKPMALLLRRIKCTQYQHTLNKDMRSKNVSEAFALLSDLDRVLYEGKHLVVIDDLMTSGATLKEAIKMLRTLKPGSITVLVAARTF